MVDNKRLYQLILMTSNYKADCLQVEDRDVETTEKLEYLKDIEEVLLELNTERMKKELVVSVCVDDFVGKQCTVTLKDGRTLTGFLSADSRYLNIVDRDTNEPCSFYGKDIRSIQEAV